MRSRLAEEARRDQLERARRMSPENRLKAFLEHSKLIGRLAKAERPDRDRPKPPPA